MRFHKRETELNKLKVRTERAASSSSGTMTMIVGRRRVGKTALLNHAYPVTTEPAPAPSLSLCLPQAGAAFVRRVCRTDSLAVSYPDLWNANTTARGDGDLTPVQPDAAPYPNSG